MRPRLNRANDQFSRSGSFSIGAPLRALARLLRELGAPASQETSSGTSSGSLGGAPFAHLPGVRDARLPSNIERQTPFDRRRPWVPLHMGRPAPPPPLACPPQPALSLARLPPARPLSTHHCQLACPRVRQPARPPLAALPPLRLQTNPWQGPPVDPPLGVGLLPLRSVGLRTRCPFTPSGETETIQPPFHCQLFCPELAMNHISLQTNVHCMFVKCPSFL